MSRELDRVQARDAPAGLVEFLPRIGACPPGSIGRPVEFHLRVLLTGEGVADGWGGGEAFLRELALGSDEFVDDPALSHQ